MSRFVRLACLASIVLFTFALPALGQSSPLPDLRDRIEEYRTDRQSIDSFYSVDGSQRKLERLERFYRDWRTRLDGIAFDALSQDAKIDWLLLSDRVERERAELAIRKDRIAADAPYAPFFEPIAALEEGRWKLATLDARATAQKLEDLKREVDAAKDAVRAEGATDAAVPPLQRPRALQLASRIDELSGALDRFSYHYVNYDPEASWWLEKPVAALRQSLSAYSEKLRRDIAGKKGGDDEPLVGEPIGRDRLLAMLRAERIAYTPEELVAIGERDLAQCDAWMTDAAKELGKESVAAALEVVKSHSAVPGAQDDLVKALAEESIALLDANDLVTIPDLCRETWRVDMMPLSDQRFLPFAAYGGQCMIVNYASDEQSLPDRQSRMRDNNVHFTRNVTPHELIPGHHLQGFMGERFRPYRRSFSTPFLGEGWCLYWEFRYLDMGWGKSPEDRLGILFWRKHRGARVVVSLRYHMGTMQPDEMIQYLKDHVGWEDGAARGEVRRFLEGGYGPLYQCAYLMGGIQLYALHSEAVKSGRMTERAFHDAVLRENAIPIELIRARLLDVPLARDGGATWKYAGDITISK